MARSPNGIGSNVKREVKTSDGDKKELARDLASFAIDGGVLVVGVDAVGQVGEAFDDACHQLGCLTG